MLVGIVAFDPEILRQVRRGGTTVGCVSGVDGSVPGRVEGVPRERKRGTGNKDQSRPERFKSKHIPLCYPARLVWCSISRSQRTDLGVVRIPRAGEYLMATFEHLLELAGDEEMVGGYTERAEAPRNSRSGRERWCRERRHGIPMRTRGDDTSCGTGLWSGHRRNGDSIRTW